MRKSATNIGRRRRSNRGRIDSYFYFANKIRNQTGMSVALIVRLLFVEREMCGIVGAVSEQPVRGSFMEGSDFDRPRNLVKCVTVE